MKLIALFLIALAAFVVADDDNDNPGWTKLTTDGVGPLPRDSIAAWAFDDGIYTFGGFNENIDPTNPHENVFYNDVWRFNTNSRKWKLITTLPDLATGTSPAPRAYSIAGRYGDEFIVGFGITYNADFSGAKAYNDLWGLNTATRRWRRIRADGATDGGPGGRAEVNAVVFQGKVFIHGGATAFFQTKADTWVFDLASKHWSLVEGAVNPSPRYGSAVALDRDNERMMIYGGERFVDYNFEYAGPDSQWALDLNTLVWTQIVPRTNIPDRNNGNGAAYINNKFFVFGGDTGRALHCNNTFFDQDNVDETWVWDANINVWTRLCPAQHPLNLKRARTVRSDGDIYIFGGFAFDSQTCGEFVFPTDVWKYTVRGCYGGTPCH